MSDEIGKQPEIGAVPGTADLGPANSHFLDEKSLESFKRQADLEESIWRSLPLFSGGLIAAAAVISSIANSLPPIALSLFPIVAYVCVTIATGLFGVSIWWLWQVVKPREFDYLPDDSLVAAYAESLTQFHNGQGLFGDGLDKAVASELRAYMRTAYIDASKSTFGHNQERLSARSQITVFLLLGFVLALAANGLEIGHRLLYAMPETKVVSNGNKTPASQSRVASVCKRGGASDSTSDENHSRRRVVVQDEHSGPSSGQGLDGGGRSKTDRTVSSSTGATSTAGGASNAATH